jgi:iron complex outermembrane receptor protein
LSYALASQANLYLRFSQGFKSAAYNVDLARSVDGLMARPEKATSYEAGFKARAWDGKAQFSLAAFHTDYDRLQVSQLIGSAPELTNAGKAEIDGVEGELSLQLTPRLRVEGNAAYLDARYKSFQDCTLPFSQGGAKVDCSGNDLVLAPNFSSYGAVLYEFPVQFGTLFARGDADYRSSVYFEPTNSDAFKGNARTLFNLRVGLRRDNWSMEGWVQNLTDRRYKTYADDRSALGVLRTAAYGAPRTYGVSLSSKF